MKLLASVVATTFAVQSDNLCPSDINTGGCYEQVGIWQQDGSANAIRCNMTNTECVEINCEFDGIKAEFRHDLFDDNPSDPKFLNQIKTGDKEVVDKFGNPLSSSGPCKFTVGAGDFAGSSLNIDWSYEDCSHLMDISLQGDEIVYSVKLSAAGDNLGGPIEFYVDHKMGADCKYPATIELDSNFWVNQEDVEAHKAAEGQLDDQFNCNFYSNAQRTANSAITANNIVNMGDTIYGEVTSNALHGLSYKLDKVTVSDANNNQLSFDVIEDGGSVAAVNSNIVNDADTGDNINFDWMSFGFAGKSDQNKLEIQCFVDLKPKNVPGCPTDYEIIQTSKGEQCVQVNKGKFKWETAKSTCHAAGTHLAVPQNEEDNRLFSDLIGYNKYDLWIGAECDETTLTYPNGQNNKPKCGSWVDANDGSELSWLKWNNKEPNNHKGNEFMVHIILTGGDSYGGKNGKWNDHVSNNQPDWADRVQYSQNNAFICITDPSN